MDSSSRDHSAVTSADSQSDTLPPPTEAEEETDSPKDDQRKSIVEGDQRKSISEDDQRKSISEDAFEREDGVIAVPMELYRIVTVLSTLIAAAFVVGGFIILDTATQGAQAPVDEINVVLALIGVGTIVLGAGIYVFSTRFQAPGMRTSKDEDD